MLHITGVGPSQPEKHTLPKRVYQKVTNNKIVTNNQPPYETCCWVFLIINVQAWKKINYEIPNIFWLSMFFQMIFHESIWIGYTMVDKVDGCMFVIIGYMFIY
jgi:hypothetical protein